MRRSSTILSRAKETETIRLVLLRHGESEWNASKKFSGWVDIDLTEKGVQEANTAGKILKANKLEFDEAHASLLKRAVRTLTEALHASDQHWIPVKHSWRLNERHYGALTGLSKKDAAREMGEEKLLQYRRGFSISPPDMDENHPFYIGNDRRYHSHKDLIPRGESLEQCQQRILPYWDEEIVPSIAKGRRVLVAAHNNVIRCICQHLDDIPLKNLVKLEIPTGSPLVYNICVSSMKPIGETDPIGFRGKILTKEAPML